MDLFIYLCLSLCIEDIGHMVYKYIICTKKKSLLLHLELGKLDRIQMINLNIKLLARWKVLRDCFWVEVVYCKL